MKASMKSILPLVMVLSALSACTIVDRKDYLEDSNAGRPLAVPPGMTPLQGDGKYDVPQAGSTAGRQAPARAAAPACACQQAAPAASDKDRPLDMPPELVLQQGASRQYEAQQASSSTGSATYSDYARQGAAAAPGCSCQQAAPVASAAPVAPVVKPVLMGVAGKGQYIHIGEPFDRCWFRVSQALDRAGEVPVDKDRSKGLFYLQGGAQLRVLGKAGKPSCDVSFADGKGRFTDDAQRRTEVLFKALTR